MEQEAPDQGEILPEDVEFNEFDTYAPSDEDVEAEAPKEDPLKELTPEEEKALTDNKAYWDARDLAWAGRLNETVEFLPGQKATLHTLDIGEQIYLGKVLDREFGKISMQTGFGSSYDVGLKVITLSLAVDYLNDEKLFEARTEKEDVFTDDLTVSEREYALDKKSRVLRRKMQAWYPHIIDKLYGKYVELLERQEEAMELLPFYSDQGERLESSEFNAN